MFHCHNLIHEDHDMMAAFNVTALPDLGYNETSYIDPMEERWRAKPYTIADLRARTGPFSEEAIVQTVEHMASFDPYSHVDEVMDALAKYYGRNGTLSRRSVDGGQELSKGSVRWRRVV